MATDLAGRPQGPGGQRVQFLEYDHFIERQLGRARSQIKSVEVLTSLAIFATGALAYLMAGAILDHWVWPGGLSSSGRWIAFAGFALAALTYLAVALVVPMVPELLRLPWLARLSRVTGLPVLRRIHLYYAARTIERSQGTMKNSLVNFLDLRRSSLPPSVLYAVERQAASDLSRVEVEHAVNRDRLIRVLYLLLGVVAVTCLYTLFSPKSTLTAFGRLLFPGAKIAAATRTRIEEVQPGSTTVFAGERVRVTARVAGRVVPEELTLYYTTATRQVVEQAVPMRPASKGSREYLVELPHDTLEGVQESFQYFLRGGDATTPLYSVRVIVPPTATVESVHYEYPAYTGLEAKTVAQGDIAALEGTEVTVHARTNMGVSRARLDFGGDAATDLPMDVSGQELLVRFRLALDDKGQAPYDSYRIDFQTTQGQRNPRPTLHTIKVRPDLPPEVSLVHPGRDVELPANGVLPLVVEASDPDFALGGVRLRVREGTDAEAEAELIPLGEPPLGPKLRATYTLDLAARGAKPGDVLHYWAEARDNKQPESNHAQTAVYTVRVTEPVSEQERRKMAEQAKQAEKAEKAPEQPKTPSQDQKSEQDTTDAQQGAEKPAEQKEQEARSDDAAPQPPKQPDASQSPEKQPSNDRDDQDKDVETLKRIMQRMKQTQPEQPQPDQQQQTEASRQQPQSGAGQQQDQSNQQSDSAQSGSKGQQQQQQQPGSEKQPDGSSSGQSKGQQSAQKGGHDARGQGAAGDEPQSSDSNQSKGRSGQSPSEPSAAPGEAPQPAPGEKQGAGAAKDGNPMGTGAQQSEGAPRDKQSPSDGSQPSGDKAGAEPGEKQGGQTIEKSTTKPGPNEPGPNPNIAERQPREDNPAGTAQPGRAGQRPEPQKDDNAPSTDKGSAPSPAQNNATSGQAMKKNPSPTSDYPVKPSASETKDPTRSPPDSDESNPPGNADPQREQHSSKTKGQGSLRQFAGAGQESEGERGDAKGENQPGTNSAGQSGGAPSDEPGKSEDGTRPGHDTRSSTPGDQRGAGTKQPGNSQSGKGPSGGAKAQPQGGNKRNQPADDSGASRDKQPGDDDHPEAPRDGSKPPADSPNQGTKDNQSPNNPSTGGGQNQQPTNQPSQGGGASSGAPNGGQPTGNATPAGAQGGNPAAGQADRSGENTEAPPGDAPTLEYTRKAANLTLDQLDDQLRRNRVDQKLLDEQGWNQKDLKDFVERMRNKLDQRSTDPAKLRDVLDRLRRPVQASTRQAGEHQREVAGVVDRGPMQAPPELRDRVSAYVKRISERSSATPKKNP